MQRLAPAGLRGGVKLEAYHQTHQPQSFSLLPSVFWDFGSLYLKALRRHSRQLLRPRHSALVKTLRRLWCRLLRQRQTQQVRSCGVRVCRHYDSQCAHVLIVTRAHRSQRDAAFTCQDRCVDAPKGGIVRARDDHAPSGKRVLGADALGIQRDRLSGPRHEKGGAAEQVTLADNNGHFSACFCVMRRERWRLLDLVLTEMRHDAVTRLPGTQKRVAVDAPPHQSHKFDCAWGLSWGFWRGAYESNRSAGVSLLFSSRWYRQGHLRRVCCPPLPLSGRCGDAVVKNGLGHFCFIVLPLLPKPSGRGEATPWRKTLDALYKWTDGLLMSLPTRCMLVLMLDENDRLRRPRAEEPHDLIVRAEVEGDSAMVRADDFVATLLSVQFSDIFGNFTAGRRLQLILAAGPCDHMPLTLDLVTNGRTPHVEGGITRKWRKCAQIPLQDSLFFFQGT